MWSRSVVLLFTTVLMMMMMMMKLPSRLLLNHLPLAVSLEARLWRPRCVRSTSPRLSMRISRPSTSHFVLRKIFSLPSWPPWEMLLLVRIFSLVEAVLPTCVRRTVFWAKRRRERSPRRRLSRRLWRRWSRRRLLPLLLPLLLRKTFLETSLLRLVLVLSLNLSLSLRRTSSSLKRSLRRRLWRRLWRR